MKKIIFIVIFVAIIFGLVVFVKNKVLNSSLRSKLNLVNVNTNPTTSPTPTTQPDPSKSAPIVITEKFEQKYTVKIGDKISFPDGLVVSLKGIEDSRCKKGVACFWAGELNPIFVISKGKLNFTQEVRLGTTTQKVSMAQGYIFSLISATDKSATIMVSFIEVTK